MSHTKGPWINHGKDGLFDSRTHGASIQSSNGEVICAVETLDPNHPEEIQEQRLANADLIAAAPDLLEALEGLIYGLHRGPGLNFEGNVKVLSQAFARAQLAILKARGKE